MISQSFTPLGYQQLTGITSSTALTVPAGANAALFIAEAQNVRFRDDGTAPTTTVGIILPSSGVEPFLYSGNLSVVRVIGAVSGAILNVAYYKVAG